MPSDNASTTPTIDVLAELPLPPVSRLADGQVRGAACVWCTIALTGETAIDLGTRNDSFAGVAAHWFPRSCRDCLKEAALQEYGDHTGTCEQCIDDPSLCETRRALRRLALDGRR